LNPFGAHGATIQQRWIFLASPKSVASKSSQHAFDLHPPGGVDTRSDAKPMCILVISERQSGDLHQCFKAPVIRLNKVNQPRATMADFSAGQVDDIGNGANGRDL